MKVQADCPNYMLLHYNLKNAKFLHFVANYLVPGHNAAVIEPAAGAYAVLLDLSRAAAAAAAAAAVVVVELPPVVAAAEEGKRSAQEETN